MNFLGKNRIFLLVSIFYFAIHLTNLTLLPIFNDESIYLDWAWSNTHMPGHLYDSLLDAKQPLMIWIFGFFENFFQDPLYAGRFVSVLIGFITLLGIYILGKNLVNKHTAIIASLLYAITPIFVFYNRQALLEAGVACTGIWTCLALINLLRSPSTKNSILLGIILGLGFFIKSSGLLFFAAATLIIGAYILKKRQVSLIKASFIVLASFFLIDLLLFINPVFWKTLSTNNRYAFTLSELISFPITSWLNSIAGFFEIGFVFITPFVFPAGVIGLYFFYKKKIKHGLIFISFFLIALFLEIFSGKNQNQRYIVSFLPFLIIPAGYIFHILWRDVLWKKMAVVIACLIPFLLTLFLIFNPEGFNSELAKISRYSHTAYTSGQTSGHGINEAMRYMQEQSKNQPAMVLFGFNIGNPESAVNLYSSKTANLAAMHIDSRLFTNLNNYQCLTSEYPLFLVTRQDQRLGMDKFFQLEKSFPNPDKTYFVGIYTLNKNCTGASASLSEMYQAPMNELFKIKAGILAN